MPRYMRDKDYRRQANRNSVAPAPKPPLPAKSLVKTRKIESLKTDSSIASSQLFKSEGSVCVNINVSNVLESAPNNP